VSTVSLAVVLFGFFFIFIAGFLIWYSLWKNEEVETKFGRGKTFFELKTKKRQDNPTPSPESGE
jgi:hypothetical protein